jgi:hypothetical protein
VVEVAIELVEAVVGRQVLVAVAKVVLAELTGRVTPCLEQAGDGRILLAHALFGARQTHLGETGAKYALAGNERGSAGGARLLAVVVGKGHALTGNAVNVRGLVADQAMGVGADV